MSLVFHPWIGKNYQRGFRGKRVLILGESHYGWGAIGRGDGDHGKKAQMTPLSVQEHIDGRKKAFWTKIAIAFLTKKPTLEEKREFWNSVAYANYVQDLLAKPRKPPTERMWERAHHSFPLILKETCPQTIIVLGYRLWNHLPDSYKAGPKISGPKTSETRWYGFGSGERALACGIRHPSSSSFNGLEWHPRVAAAIDAS